VVRERRRPVEERRHAPGDPILPVPDHRRCAGSALGEGEAVPAVRAEESHPARRHRLEPAQPQEAVGGGGVDRCPLGLQDAREGEQRRARLAWLEGLQDQLGESVADRKR
jgi:hypothetical protein